MASSARASMANVTCRCPGGWPWEGVNALKAATLAMTGMDFQRETFRDDDNVRIHWNLTKGGEAVSAVPDDVRLGADRVGPLGHSTAGTDVGDLGHIMPVCQPLATGVTSAPHTEFYHVTDHVKAAVNPAKFMAMTVVDLLYDGAAEARRVIAEAAPSKITKDEYLAIRRPQDTHEVFDGGLRG